MAAKLSSFDQQYEQSVLIEFEPDMSEEEFRALTESLQSDQDLLETGYGQLRRNVAVNVSDERPVPDQFKEMSSQELTELDQRVSEILKDAANGIIPAPDQPEIKFEDPAENILQQPDNNEPYTGPTTITYDIPGRSHLRIPVPVYKCPDGGIVNVNVSIDRNGRVIRADIEGSPGNYNEICIFQMALESALGSRFNEKSDAPPVQSGIITFYFQKQ